MNTPHKHADILRAIADGKRIQHRPNSGWGWADADLETLIHAPKGEFRIAPETIVINGVECPKPLSHPFDGGKWIISIQLGEHKGSIHNGETLVCKDYNDASTVFDALCKPLKEGV